MPGVLKVGPNEPSEEQEIEFELRYQQSLTTAQRFETRNRQRRVAKATKARRTSGGTT